MNSFLGMKLLKLFFPKFILKLCLDEGRFQVEGNRIFMIIYEGKGKSIKIKGIWVYVMFEGKYIKFIPIVH